MNMFLLMISEIVGEWLAGYPVLFLELFLCINSLNSHKHSERFLSLFSRCGILISMPFGFWWVSTVLCKTWLLLLAYQCVEVFLILKAFFCQGMAKHSPWAKSILLPIFFCMAYELRRVCKFLKCWEKIKIMFHDTCKLREIQISVSVSKVSLAHSHTQMFPYCLWPIRTRMEGWVVLTDTI